MSESTLLILGIISAAISVVGWVPYVRDIFAGKTKPERWSFFIWTLLGVIFLITQAVEGATDSLIYTGVLTIAPAGVFILSIKYGVGGFDRIHKLALALIVASLLGWWLAGSALLGLAIAIFIDSIGMSLTAKKVYFDPSTETLSTWQLGVVSSLFAMASIGEWDLALLLFPGYVALVTGFMSVLIIWRRK